MLKTGENPLSDKDTKYLLSDKFSSEIGRLEEKIDEYNESIKQLDGKGRRLRDALTIARSYIRKCDNANDNLGGLYSSEEDILLKKIEEVLK